MRTTTLFMQRNGNRIANNFALLILAFMLASCMSDGVPSETDFLRGEIRAVDSDSLTFSLTNTSTRKLAILAWNIPAIYGDLDRDVFKVRQQDSPARYTGPIVEYLPTSEENILTLEPGQTITTNVAIRGSYALIAKQNCYVIYDTCLQFAIIRKGRRPPSIKDLTQIECITTNEIELPPRT